MHSCGGELCWKLQADFKLPNMPIITSYIFFMFWQTAGPWPFAAQLHAATDLNEGQNPGLSVGTARGQADSANALTLITRRETSKARRMKVIIPNPQSKGKEAFIVLK